MPYPEPMIALPAFETAACFPSSRSTPAPGSSGLDPYPLNLNHVVAIIPARDEAETITAVIRGLQDQGLRRIRVVDNGSRDHTARMAQAAGAEVILEPRPGYGQACWQGLQALAPEVAWILFCDGDGSDDLSKLPDFFALAARYDFILGNRRATLQGRQALTPVQNFGNWLATRLIAWGWGHDYNDLGPLRLIRRDALERIAMGDRNFGWTVEMQARAVELGLAIAEVAVGYRDRQGGRSKISGTLKGSLQAGIIILSTLGKLYGRHWMQRRRH